MRNSQPMTIERTHAQRRDSAMRKCGIDPHLVALKPGTRRQANRKALATRGYLKHKGSAFL